MGFSVVDLRTRPDLVPVLAAWNARAWGDWFPEDDEAALTAFYRSHLGPGPVPSTFVAVGDGGEPWGCGSLVADDELPGWSDRGPWVALVWVEPARRAAGAGAALVEACIARADDAGAAEVLLYTEDRRQWYEARGWTFLAEADQRGRHVDVLRTGGYREA